MRGALLHLGGGRDHLSAMIPDPKNFLSNPALLDEALAAAARIAGYSLPIVMMAKETVNRAQESSLAEGARFERRLFLSMFATEDQKEGMKAFIEKRKPNFHNR